MHEIVFTDRQLSTAADVRWHYEQRSLCGQEEKVEGSPNWSIGHIYSASRPFAYCSFQPSQVAVPLLTN